MSERRTYLDAGIGETRGVVTLDGRPERLLLQRDDDDPRLTLGARLVARVATVESAIGTAYLDLGGGLQAMLPFKADSRPVRGRSLTVEIRGEPRDGKLAVARSLGDGEGEPRLVQSPSSVLETLRRLVPDVDIVHGRDARQAADAAEQEVLDTVYPLHGGGDIAIEATRALTAVDVDLGGRSGQDAKRASRQANLTAIGEAARLLRLKGLGGIIVFDLIGRGHDGNALLAAARLAFAPDNPGVAIGPVGRFGTMELSIPRRTRPILERLRQPDGRLSDRTLAQRLLRRIEAEASAQPGARIDARCAPNVARTAERLGLLLAERIGARFAITADPACPGERLDVSAK